MFTIPSPINFNYSNVGLRPVAGSLVVGAAIKDLQEGSLTPTKKEHERKIVEIQNKFEQDTKAYHEQMEVLTDRAAKAEGHIGSSRAKKALAITLLAISIVAVVGLTVAAIATGALPLLFVAAPFIVGIASSSYFTHVQRKEVSGLEDTINAPLRLKKPQLLLPAYDPSKDYDLFQSRSDAQNAIAQMSLAKLAKSHYTTNAVIKYALLDRVAQVPANLRPLFYSKCIQLIENYGTIVREQRDYNQMIDNEAYRLKRDLTRWTSDQEHNLSSQQMLLDQRERELNKRARRGELVSSLDRLSLQLAFSGLENQKLEFARTSERRAIEINHWREQMVGQSDSLFQQSVNQIEQQYGALKTGAL